MKSPLDMAQELDQIPQAVYALQLELIESNDSVEANEKAITDLEIEIKSQVLNALDDAGKKMYTNDEARKMAFVSDCNESTEYRELIAKRSELSKQMQIKRSKIEMLSNQQRNLRVLIQSFSAVEAI
jgi:enolase